MYTFSLLCLGQYKNYFQVKKNRPTEAVFRIRIRFMRIRIQPKN